MFVRAKPHYAHVAFIIYSQFRAVPYVGNSVLDLKKSIIIPIISLKTPRERKIRSRHARDTKMSSRLVAGVPSKPSSFSAGRRRPQSR